MDLNITRKLELVNNRIKIDIKKQEEQLSINKIEYTYYNNSDYFSKPTKDDKILLVCSNKDEVFYFSLLIRFFFELKFKMTNTKINPTRNNPK